MSPVLLLLWNVTVQFDLCILKIHPFLLLYIFICVHVCLYRKRKQMSIFYICHLHVLISLNVSLFLVPLFCKAIVFNFVIETCACLRVCKRVCVHIKKNDNNHIPKFPCWKMILCGNVVMINKAEGLVSGLRWEKTKLLKMHMSFLFSRSLLLPPLSLSNPYWSASELQQHSHHAPCRHLLCSAEKKPFLWPNYITLHIHDCK